MKKYYLTLLVLISLLFSCSEHRIIYTPDKYATISATKSTDKFAASADFLSGSQIGVYMTTASAGLKQSGNHVNNAIFTSSASVFTSKDVLYPDGVANLDLYAYAPHSATGIDVSKMLSFSVEAAQTTPDKSDLLWATKQGVPSGTTPALVFDHKLAQIVVKLTAATGVVLTSPTVTIAGTLPAVKLNVEKGTLGAASGTAQNIEATVISASELHAIIVPQVVAQGTEFLLVKNGSKVFKHVLAKANTFVSGMSYTFEITVKNNAIDVKFTGSVNGWNSGDTTPGEAV